MSNKKKWSKDELVDCIKNFHQALLYIDHEKSSWSEGIDYCNKVFCDARHYIELEYPKTREGRTRICQIIRDSSRDRREYKDLLDVLEPIIQLIDAGKCARIYEISNKISRRNAQLSNRTYTPRAVDLTKDSKLLIEKKEVIK
jgi:hypothetical protein